MRDLVTSGGTCPSIRGGITLLLCLFASVVSANAKEDAGAQWVSAYAWIQTGDQLAAADLWPLAIGSYIEADRQIKILAAEHPSFEPEIVSYRIEKLKENIESAQKQLTAGEHDIMMNYLDFIESFELGQKQRFENNFEESLSTLSAARSLLDELIEEKPDEFEAAVKSQHELLDDSIDWLYSQVSFKRQSVPVVSVGDGYNWGSTQYVKESEMPSSDDPVEPMGLLFPTVPVAAGDKPTALESKPKGKETGEVDAKETAKESGETGGSLRFRMNSKSEPAGGDVVNDKK